MEIRLGKFAVDIDIAECVVLIEGLPLEFKASRASRNAVCSLSIDQVFVGRVLK